MRFCAACDKTYAESIERCPVHHSFMRLVADSANETLPVAMTALAAGAGGGGTPMPAQTLAPRADAPSVSDSLVGGTLADRYEVTRKVGQGGMGAVYEAKHLLIGKRVAVKVLLDKYAKRDDVVARLRQEARLASSIGHEHIVDITDIGETRDGRTFVVMEFLEGESLAQLLAREGALPPARAIAIVRQVAGALGAAHSKGIVHRDVKPENVFIVKRSDKDFAKVVDFGISKALRAADESEPGEDGLGGASSPRLTHTGMVLGTPLYMSPEQARGEEQLDERIDVYALGVILYELLTGETPFRGTNYLNVIAQVLSQEPRRPSAVRPDLGLSPAVEAVVVRAMAKDREARYPTMAALDADLARIERGEDALASDASLSALAARQTRTRGQLMLWGAGLLGLAGGTVAVIMALTRGDTPPAPPVRPPDPPKVAEPVKVPVLEPPPVAPERTIPKVTVNVDSVPEGAEIYWGAVSLGTTPQPLSFNKNDETITLTLRLPGYGEAVVPFQPDHDLTLPTIKLVKLKPGQLKKPPAQGSGSGSSTGGSNGEIMNSPYGAKKDKEKVK